MAAFVETCAPTMTLKSMVSGRALWSTPFKDTEVSPFCEQDSQDVRMFISLRHERRRFALAYFGRLLVS